MYKATQDVVCTYVCMYILHRLSHFKCPILSNGDHTVGIAGVKLDSSYVSIMSRQSGVEFRSLCTLTTTTFHCTKPQSTVPNHSPLYQTTAHCTKPQSTVPNHSPLYQTTVHCTKPQSTVPNHSPLHQTTVHYEYRNTYKIVMYRSKPQSAVYTHIPTQLQKNVPSNVQSL